MIDIDSELRVLLAGIESSLTVDGIRSTLATTARELREDNIAHGLPGDGPFWDLLSDERTHVFTVMDSTTLDLYAFAHSDFHGLISQLNMLSMSEIASLRELLSSSYGIENPQISVTRSQAEYWLSA